MLTYPVWLLLLESVALRLPLADAFSDFPWELRTLAIFCPIWANFIKDEFFESSSKKKKQHTQELCERIPFILSSFFCSAFFKTDIHPWFFFFYSFWFILFFCLLFVCFLWHSSFTTASFYHFSLYPSFFSFPLALLFIVFTNATSLKWS